MKRLSALKYISVSIAIALVMLSMAKRLMLSIDTALQGGVQKTGKLIMIDPGHGGSDPGAVSKNGTKESELNMRVSLYLAEYLMSYGYDVVLTRGTNTDIIGADTGLSTAERKQKIAQSGCDLLVSVHMNIFSDRNVSGAEVLYYSKSVQSFALARAVQNSFVMNLDKNNKRQIKANDDLFVLKSCDAPSVLVECGYISNAIEEAKLVTPEYQRRVAYAICCGITTYFNSDNV